MDFQTFGQIPALYETAIVTDAAVFILKNTRYTYALVQFQEVNVGDFAEPSRVGRYRVDGVAPTVAEGFLAGANDTRIFTQGELKGDTQLISAEAGASFKVVIEYYNKL